MIFDSEIMHFSFDAWNTLVSANPQFSQLRIAHIAKLYNADIQTAEKAFQSVKFSLDKLAEIYGLSCSIDESYNHLNNQLPNNRSVNLIDLRAAVDKLFKENPPYVLPETIEMLNKITLNNRSIGILSNTNFISGRILRETMFNRWNLCFASLIFSDEYKIAKPSPLLCAKIINEIQISNQQTLSPNNILHIGDNERTDGRILNIKTLIIQNPRHLVSLFKETNYA